MTEGLNVQMVVSGATLVAVGGLGVKLWLASRGQRITPQPLTVQAAAESTPSRFCDERHQAIDKDRENLFARMSGAEQRLARAEATIVQIEQQYRSIDGKLDALLRR